ncbi:20414_t:CDS:2, partial [Dentiscutata erythropus]
ECTEDFQASPNNPFSKKKEKRIQKENQIFEDSQIEQNEIDDSQVIPSDINIIQPNSSNDNWETDSQSLLLNIEPSQ